MKKGLVLIFFLIFTISSFSQLSTVTGGNIGASISGGYLLNKPTGNGFGVSAGITTSFFEVFFPEINYEYSSSSYGIDTAGSEIMSTNNYLGLGINNKIPLFALRMGKSKHQECWYLKFKLLFDYKYRLNLGKGGVGFDPVNQSGLNFGLGIRPSFSGSDKSRVAWAFFYDVFYHLDLNKSSYVGVSGLQQNGLFLRFTFLHYKTSNMLGGDSKKKAYKRNY